MLRGIGHWLLSDRKKAIIVAMLLVITPFLNWLGVCILGLVTLRKGAKEGFIALLWISLPTVVLAAMGHYFLLLHQLIFYNLLIWVLALVLRHTRSWTSVFETGTILGIAGVLLTHLLIPNTAAWWTQRLSGYLKNLPDQIKMPISAGNIPLERLGAFATGIETFGILFFACLVLVLARAWQANLFNRGALHNELRQIHLNKRMVWILILILVAAIAKIKLAYDLLPVIYFLLVFCGISLADYRLGMLKKTRWFWQAVFYALLVVCFPYMSGIVAILAILDVWFNFRKRGTQRGSHPANKGP